VILRRVQANDVGRILDDIMTGRIPTDLALCKIEEWDHITAHIATERLPEHSAPGTRCRSSSGQKKIVLRNCGLINPDDIEEYIAVGGYQSLYKVLIDGKPELVIEQIKASKLRGRGGAGFLTGQVGVPAQAEGEPEVHHLQRRRRRSRRLHEPQRDRERSALAAGGHDHRRLRDGRHPGHHLCARRVSAGGAPAERAIEQARDYGLLGDNILGRGFNFDIELVEGAGAFVCGEETALIASLEGFAGRPRPRPPFPGAKGLWGKPTNINNVETWYNIAPIVAKGPAWFTETGSTKSAGTKVFSLVGKVTNTGLVEMPLGTPLKTLRLRRRRGRHRSGPIKAVQTGGPSGGCIPQEMFDTPVDYETLAQLGSIMGSGGMVVMDEDNCMVDVARYFIEFTHSESCGKCIPCRVGLDKALRILNAFTKGTGRRQDLDRAGRTGPHDPRLLAVRAGPDRAQSGAHHACAISATSSRTTSRQALPRRRLPETWRFAVRKQLPAAHEHPALPAALQGRPAGGRLRIGDHGQSAAGLHRPRLPASLRQPLPPPRSTKRSTCAKCIASSPTRCCSPTISTTLAAASPARKMAPTDRKVAVVGAGPTGLTAAFYLALLGHEVTVSKAMPRPAACCATRCPNTGCPRPCSPRNRADRRLGVKVRLQHAVGDIPLNELDEQFDAVFLSIGTWKESWVYLPGTELKGVCRRCRSWRRSPRGEAGPLGARWRSSAAATPPSIRRARAAHGREAP
jgi:NADH-quinone oxidoreductase subunit F